MLFLSFYLGLILLDAQAFYITPSLYFLLLTSIFLPGPLLLGYIGHISTEPHVTARDFIPATLPFLVVLTCSNSLADGAVFGFSQQSDYQTDIYVGLFNLISVMAGLLMLVYIVSSVRLLLKLRSNWADYQSQTLPQSWHKMVQVMMVTLVVTVCQVASAFGHPSGDSVSVGDLAFIGFVCYFISVTIKTAIENMSSAPSEWQIIEEGAVLEGYTPDVDAQGLDEVKLECERMRSQVIKQGFHLQSDLTLPNLASALNMTPHKLSMSINNGLGITFYEFINDLRIATAADLLIKYPDKSITDVFFEAGFTAKSTFYSHFKKVHGVTPTQYRQQASN
ncbi:MAG: AraC-like DNA-binding protein [Bermanella sp.]|jgi:AraC-like DNA-binding protein